MLEDCCQDVIGWTAYFDNRLNSMLVASSFLTVFSWHCRLLVGSHATR